ncbi:MAG: hypothetical protein EA349_07020 [Halomonadaceae bacterium]|nr:MAG: hypothetical protein EA349_07020 [Halomonadaceae bacterium]
MSAGRHFLKAMQALSHLLMGLCLSVGLAQWASAAEEKPPHWGLTLEAGPAWFSRNDARIPNDAQGDRFDVTDLSGSGATPSFRINLDYHWDQYHSVRATYAPLRIAGTNVLGDDTRFAGELFEAGEPTKATYIFNTYRLGYRYTWHESDRWQTRVGASLLIRDANIRLQQGNTVADDPDLGVVPLLSLQITRFLSPRWSAELDVEGLAAPQGRAFDAALAAQYQWHPNITTRVGYRTLEGGADNDSVYTFAWVHYLFAGLRLAF